jgi:hypothetical protein
MAEPEQAEFSMMQRFKCAQPQQRVDRARELPRLGLPGSLFRRRFGGFFVRLW